MRLINILVPGLPVLGEAVLTIDWPALSWLERYFTLFLAVGANGLVHFSWAEISPASKSTETHDDFSVRNKILHINKHRHSIKSYVLKIFL
jgi:hypothetical protein